MLVRCLLLQSSFEFQRLGARALNQLQTICLRLKTVKITFASENLAELTCLPTVSFFFLFFRQFSERASEV